LQVAYHPKDRHAVRLLVLSDQTDRDADRFLADELSYEVEDSVELTYVFQKSAGLSILAGAKVQREDDSELNDSFTSEREVYIKFKYDFNMDLF
jgi:hypothetical protein